jgi:hypothetical protein
MPRIAFDSFSVQTPVGWEDITDSVEAEAPPSTLAHRDGVGALQFSVALYVSGPVPDPTPAVLREMLEEFGVTHNLGEPTAVVEEIGPPSLAAGSFRDGEDVVRVWQVSHGGNFAFITYTCAADNLGSELAACERIVRSIAFRPRGTRTRS